MAKIAFSRPQGRVEVFYPDEMSIQDLEDTLLVHLSVAKMAQPLPHNPPETGVPKRALQEAEAVVRRQIGMARTVKLNTDRMEESSE